MRAKRIDENQVEIVKQLRKIPNLSVSVTSSLGNGYPDLNIGYKGKNFLIELKDGSKPPSARKLTEDEQEFRRKWEGQYAICNDLDEILTVIFLK